MEELLRPTLLDPVVRRESDRRSRRIRSLAVRACLWLAMALLAGALAAGFSSPLGLAWFGGRAQAAVSSPGLSLSPSSWPTYPGATFDVDIVAAGNPNADSAAAVVTYDAAHLQVNAFIPDTSVFETTLFQQSVSGQVQYQAGSLTCHAAGTCPSGPFRLATIRFTVLGQCGYSVPLAVSGQVLWVGTYGFNGTGTGSTIGISIAGDVDLDRGVDVVDIMLVAGRWSSVRGQPRYDARYDLNADGVIDTVDIMFVAQRWNQTCSS